MADLFDADLAHHRDDPDTSVEAAERVNEFANRHHKIILEVLGGLPYGLTSFEITEHCELTQRQVNKRLCELERGGKIVKTTVVRDSPSGRSATVWAHSFFQYLHLDG